MPDLREEMEGQVNAVLNGDAVPPLDLSDGGEDGPTGFSFPQPKEEKPAPDAPAAPQPDPELRSRLDRLEGALSGRHHQAPDPAQTAAAVIAQMQQYQEAQRQQQEFLRQRQQQWQAPELEDPDELITDGRKADARMKQLAENAYRRAREEVMAEIGPYAQHIQQQVQYLSQAAQYTRGAAVQQARENAAGLLERAGIPRDDFDSAWGDLEQRFTQAGMADRMADPNMLAQAYLSVALEQGKPIARPAQSRAPVTTRPKPSQKAGDRSALAQLSQQVHRDAQSVARNLGLGNSLPLESEEELRAVGLLRAV